MKRAFWIILAIVAIASPASADTQQELSNYVDRSTAQCESVTDHVKQAECFEGVSDSMGELSEAVALHLGGRDLFSVMKSCILSDYVTEDKLEYPEDQPTTVAYCVIEVLEGAG
jgi:hypothetical protein